MAPKKVAWGPSDESNHTKGGHRSGTPGIGQCKQTPFLNPDPFQHWYRVENVAKVKINRESCMALLDNGTQINTIMPSYVKSHSLEVGPITNLIARWVTYVGLWNAYTWPLGCVVIQVQVDGVQGYNEDQIALVVPDFIKFHSKDPHYIRDPHYKLHHKCHDRERHRCLGNTLDKWQGCPSLVMVQRAMATVEDDKAMEESDPDGYDKVVITRNMETVDAFSSRVIPM